MKLLNKTEYNKMTAEEQSIYRENVINELEQSIEEQSYNFYDPYADMERVEVTCKLCGHVNRIVDFDSYCFECDAHL